MRIGHVVLQIGDNVIIFLSVAMFGDNVVSRMCESYWRETMLSRVTLYLWLGVLQWCNHCNMCCSGTTNRDSQLSAVCCSGATPATHSAVVHLYHNVLYFIYVYVYIYIYICIYTYGFMHIYHRTCELPADDTSVSLVWPVSLRHTRSHWTRSSHTSMCWYSHKYQVDSCVTYW